MKYIVTGGAGFIGTALVKRLLANGDEVVVIDNLERGNEPEPHENLKFYKEDLREERVCQHLLGNADVLVHLASKVGGIGVYLSQAAEIFSANIDIDKNVIDAAIAGGIENIVYASSAHVYPLDFQETKNRVYALSEPDSDPASPGLSYGWGKLFTEKYLQFLSDEHDGLSVKIARYVGIYGPGASFEPKTASVLPVLCYRAIKYPEENYEIWGTGEELRTYCYIDDAIDATLLMSKAEVPFLILNIGTEELVSINQIAQKVIDISEKNIELTHVEGETLIWSQHCSMVAAEVLLKWKAKVTLDEGLKIVYNDIVERTND